MQTATFGASLVGDAVINKCTSVTRLFTSSESLNPQDWVLDTTIDAGSPVHSLAWRHHSPDIAPALLLGMLNGGYDWQGNSTVHAQCKPGVFNPAR